MEDMKTALGWVPPAPLTYFAAWALQEHPHPLLAHFQLPPLSG